jgi:hypothetical protein
MARRPRVGHDPFLCDVRTTVISLVSIPRSLLVAIIVLAGETSRSTW